MVPGITYFRPRGVPLRFLEEVVLTVEELEAVRLKDLENLDGEQAAERMGVSRPTFQRILDSARRKVAEALVGGKALRIHGGDFEVAQRTTPNALSKDTGTNVALPSSGTADRYGRS